MSSNLRPFVWSTLLVRPGVFELADFSEFLYSDFCHWPSLRLGSRNIQYLGNAPACNALLAQPSSLPIHPHFLYFSVIWMTIQPPNSCSLSDPFWSARHQILNFKVIVIGNCNLYPCTMYFQLKYSAPKN